MFWYSKNLQLWKKQKAEIAKFNSKTKEEILERDWRACALCWSSNILQIHHIHFWNLKKRIKRNCVQEWICICQNCHHQIHNPITKEHIGLRIKAIEYVNNLYWIKETILTTLNK